LACWGYTTGHATGWEALMGKIAYGRLQPAVGSVSAQQYNDLIRTIDQIMLQLDTDAFRLGENRTPTSAADTGQYGEIVFDSDYIYICTDTDTWKRAAIATW
jgi:hypothetical protein